MDVKIKQMREKAEELIGKMKALLDTADAESRDLTDAETAEYAALETESDKTQRDIERLARLAEREAQAQAHADKPHIANFRKKAVPAKEFRNIGEFLYAVACNRNDPRLQDCEYREQSMSAGNEGGFAVPEQFRPELLQVQPQDAIFRPRCQVIPAGDPPDARITMPALDQTAAENIYGGVVVAKVAEGGAKGETDIALKEVSLEPGEVAAYITVTDKLLRNWAAASNLLAGQLRKAIIGWEDTQILTGNGIGGPLGITNAPCRVNVARATAATIVVADIQNMYSRAKFGGSLFWVGSQTILPQLLGMVDGASNRIFAPSVAEGVPPTLFGLPLLYADRSPALGSKGDLVLADCGYYLIKDGSGPFVATDLGIGNFTTNKV